MSTAVGQIQLTRHGVDDFGDKLLPNGQDRPAALLRWTVAIRRDGLSTTPLRRSERSPPAHLANHDAVGPQAQGRF